MMVPQATLVQTLEQAEVQDQVTVMNQEEMETDGNNAGNKPVPRK